MYQALIRVIKLYQVSLRLKRSILSIFISNLALGNLKVKSTLQERREEIEGANNTKSEAKSTLGVVNFPSKARGYEQ